MNCSTTKKYIRNYFKDELAGIQKSAIEDHLRTCAECSDEAEFDQYLRQIDDFYGEAPGLKVPADFLSRVVESAQVSRPHVTALAERQPLWNWFLNFGLPLRVAVVSMLLLATIGGLQAGHVISNMLTHADEPKPPIITPDLIPTEQSLVMLMNGEGLVLTGQPTQVKGEQQ